MLVNTTRTYEELGLGSLLAEHPADRLLTVPATDIARRHLGKPVPNAVLLAGFAAMTDLVTLDAVVDAIRARFPGDMGQRNEAAAREAFDAVIAERTFLQEGVR